MSNEQPHKEPAFRCLMIQDGECVTHFVMVPIEPEPIKKKPFSVRHPRIHHTFVRFRKVCIVLNPVVEFAGNAANCVTGVRVLRK